MMTRRRLSEETARRAMRWAMLILLISTTVLERIGVSAGEFSISPGLVAMYLVLGVGAVAGSLVISASRTALFLPALGVALISAMLNEDRSSFGSLLLLVVMYIPFMFVLQSGSLAERDADWMIQQFLNLTFFCACVGIVQFFAQFAIHGEWLFDYTVLIPSALRGGGVFNTVIPVGSFNKSNGFFFREPSGFSFMMGLAVIAESVTRRRVPRIACYALALLLTYSGTGILTLLIGAVYPLGRKTLLRLGIVAAVGGLVFALFDDTLNLSYTFSRLGEFSADSSRSSGYIRYIAPGRLLGELFTSEPWTAFVGHGPGTISRVVREYEFHDPTWAKLLFEYGALGFVLFVALFAVTLRHPGIPVQLRATLFWAWLITGGHLLSPEQNYLTLALVGVLPFAAVLSSGRQWRSEEWSADEPPAQLELQREASWQPLNP
jgi:hypothetical protein